MTAQLEILREKKLDRARKALERARDLRRTRRDFGIDGICHHITDVDGDWIENWSDEASISMKEVRENALSV